MLKSFAVHEAVGNPVRAHILNHMGEHPRRASSPKVVAKALDLSLGVVAYHFRILARDRMVRLVRTRPVRGATAHDYRLTALGIRAAKVAGRIIDIIEEEL